MGTGFIKETMFVGEQEEKKDDIKKRDVGVYLNLTAKKKILRDRLIHHF
jgi:hypothetical protein